MARKTNLDSGFLFLYDWLPMMDMLPPKEFKALLLALIERQRENKALPTFKSPLTDSFARIIEPTIRRRLDAANGKKQERESEHGAEHGTEHGTEHGAKHGTPPSTAERSEAERSEAKQSAITAELSGANTTPSPAEPVTEAAKPQGALRALSEPEKEALREKGIPEDYIEERATRALQIERRCGRSATQSLIDWWRQDRPKTIPYRGEEPRDQQRGSFDTEDFWDAALRRTYGEDKADFWGTG